MGIGGYTDLLYILTLNAIEVLLMVCSACTLHYRKRQIGKDTQYLEVKSNIFFTICYIRPQKTKHGILIITHFNPSVVQTDLPNLQTGPAKLAAIISACTDD